MPAFSWEIDETHIQWNATIHDGNELLYHMLTALEELDVELEPSTSPLIDFEDALYLRMYSALETRWCTIESFKIVKSEWPFIDLDNLFERRHRLWREIRQHAQGFRDTIHNPCGEMPLEGSYETTNLNFDPEDWEELMGGATYFPHEPGYMASKR